MSPYECTCNSGFVPDDDGPGCVGKLKTPNTETKGTRPSVWRGICITLSQDYIS